MIKRGFLIHNLPTSTEIARFETLLTEYKDATDRIQRSNGRVSNGEEIQLQMLRDSMQEMMGNEDLKEGFYFDIKNVKKKIEGHLSII